MSFVEPWLGGKKPNALSFSLYKSISSNGQEGDERNHHEESKGNNFRPREASHVHETRNEKQTHRFQKKEK